MELQLTTNWSCDNSQQRNRFSLTKKTWDYSPTPIIPITPQDIYSPSSHANLPETEGKSSHNSNPCNIQFLKSRSLYSDQIQEIPSTATTHATEFPAESPLQKMDCLHLFIHLFLLKKYINFNALAKAASPHCLYYQPIQERSRRPLLFQLLVVPKMRDDPRGRKTFWLLLIEVAMIDLKYESELFVARWTSTFMSLASKSEIAGVSLRRHQSIEKIHKNSLRNLSIIIVSFKAVSGQHALHFHSLAMLDFEISFLWVEKHSPWTFILEDANLSYWQEPLEDYCNLIMSRPWGKYTCTND